MAEESIYKRQTRTNVVLLMIQLKVYKIKNGKKMQMQKII
jgi:hypothetical protein